MCQAWSAEYYGIYVVCENSRETTDGQFTVIKEVEGSLIATQDRNAT